MATRQITAKQNVETQVETQVETTELETVYTDDESAQYWKNADGSLVLTEKGEPIRVSTFALSSDYDDKAQTVTVTFKRNTVTGVSDSESATVTYALSEMPTVSLYYLAAIGLVSILNQRAGGLRTYMKVPGKAGSPVKWKVPLSYTEFAERIAKRFGDTLKNAKSIRDLTGGKRTEKKDTFVFPPLLLQAVQNVIAAKWTSAPDAAIQKIGYVRGMSAEQWLKSTGKWDQAGVEYLMTGKVIKDEYDRLLSENVQEPESDLI